MRQSSQPMDKPKVPIRKMPSSTPYRQSEYLEQSKHRSKKPVIFEDNLSLSEEEEDIILAQCIKSGMPKVKINVFFSATFGNISMKVSSFSYHF